MRLQLSLLALSAALLVTACADDDTHDDAMGDAGSTTPRATYHDDVAQIFADHCMSCHVEGGVGPFVLDDPEVARVWGETIAASVTARTMPPFGVNNDGSCNTFQDANWLTDEEIETINAWVEDGMAEGEPPAEELRIPEPPTLVGDDIIELRTPAGYVPVPETYPGGEFEDYQCFLVQPDHTQDRFVVGYDVIPGNAATVHHVLAFEVDPAAFNNGARMAERDAMSPDQPGWDCLSAAGEDVYPEGVPVSWAPGVGAVNVPAGTGIRLEAGHALVIQMHYNLANSTDAGETVVQVALQDEVAQEGVQNLFDPFLFESFSTNPTMLPAGQPSVTYSWEAPMNQALFLEAEDREIDVYGLLPHMHQRGRTMSIDFEVDGVGDVCGADVDRYDFDWQRNYFLEQPLRMKLSDVMHVTCEWDTTGDTQDIPPGFGTADEMCLVGLYVVPR